MNANQLKDKLKNESKKRHIDFNTLLRLYMYDRFIERLAISKYKDNFILKGGFYLSVLFGIENRHTMDIDTAIKNTEFNEKNIIKMIKQIISIDIHDNAEILFDGIEQIREEDLYGGYRVHLIVKVENIQEKFHIDIATGDPITPKEITYHYQPILKEQTIKIWTYNLETSIAEKFETILSRLELNSRMKDFYDIYLICSNNWNTLNKENLKLAIDKTFQKRDYNRNILESLKIIKNSDLLQKRWEDYKNNHEYAQNIAYQKIINILYEVFDVYTK